MLQFLNPIWLFGISAILIPLIIHLWNIKTGKTLKVGSITLMGESSRQNSRSLKLMDLLLLFLRCLIIIILSALLAEPVWRSANSKEKTKAWILAEKENLSETYSTFKTEIDSLISSGSEFHFLEPGFKKADLAEAVTDSTRIDTSGKVSYWPLLKLLDQKIPPGTNAYLFTNDRLNRFNGPRPELTTAITWKTYTPADSTSQWIENAYLSASGDIRTSLAESSPSGIIRKTVNLNPATSNTEISTTISNGKPLVQLSGQQIIADTTTLEISIYSSEFPGDAEYLRAAINAIQSYTSRKIKLVQVNAEKDFLFWLSAKEIPAGILKTITPGGTLLKYAIGKTTVINSWIETEAVQLSAEPAALHKRINYTKNAKAFPVWEDGFGTPLLNLTSANDISTYTLYTRLDPQWTDLVWSPEFVKFLMPIIIPVTPSAQQEKSDTRSISNIQLPQSSKLLAHSSKQENKSESALKYYFWLLLLAVFLTERWLSFKNTPVG